MVIMVISFQLHDVSIKTKHLEVSTSDPWCCAVLQPHSNEDEKRFHVKNITFFLLFFVCSASFKPLRRPALMDPLYLLAAEHRNQLLFTFIRSEWIQ